MRTVSVSHITTKALAEAGFFASNSSGIEVNSRLNK